MWPVYPQGRSGMENITYKNSPAHPRRLACNSQKKKKKTVTRHITSHLKVRSLMLPLPVTLTYNRPRSNCHDLPTPYCVCACSHLLYNCVWMNVREQDVFKCPSWTLCAGKVTQQPLVLPNCAALLGRITVMWWDTGNGVWICHTLKGINQWMKAFLCRIA